MSFYNPNIQAAFEADEHEFIVLRNALLASYDMVFKIQDGCSVSAVENLRAAYQLEFLRIENATQQHNLELVDVNFVTLLSEITIEVLIGKANTFDEFLHCKLEYTPEIDRNEVLYLGDFIQDYIELLVYSDVASVKQSKGERDFTKLLGVSNPDSEVPVFYNLYDRLKLYARLRKEIRLEIDKNKIKIKGREVRLELKLII